MDNVTINKEILPKELSCAYCNSNNFIKDDNFLLVQIVIILLIMLLTVLQNGDIITEMIINHLILLDVDYLQMLYYLNHH